MTGMANLMREYERARFPAHRRLDIHGEGPQAARDLALKWIQSRAHEAPGEDLLLIVERGGRPGRPPGPVASSIQKLLSELEGKLIDWWQHFAPGSIACRIAEHPNMLPRPELSPSPSGDGRTSETAGAAHPSPTSDIPAELLETATRAAELRIEREDLSVRLMEVVLREIWIEAQAMAMEDRLTFAAALDSLVSTELHLTLQSE